MTAPRLQPPVFELGLKAWVYGRAALDLALAADKLSAQYQVTVILAPQSVDIAPIAQATEHLRVFAQHADPIPVGPGHGTVLPEAAQAAGAAGIQVNHVEKPVSLRDLSATVARAQALGMQSLVYADSPQQAAALAALGPDLILAEPPHLIGGDQSVANNRRFIEETCAAVRAVAPDVRVLNSAGIRTARDAAAVIEAGADGTGTTSGVVRAQDPVAALEAMLRAVREAWDKRPATTFSDPRKQ